MSSCAQPAQCAPEAGFLRALFCALQQQGIRYAVMRNYQPLPYSAGGSDLDILVHPQDEGPARAAIDNAIREACGVALGYSNTIGFFKVYAYGRGATSRGEWWGQRLDVSVGLRYAGVAWLVDNQVLTSGYCLHNGIRVLPDQLGAVLGVLKELLHNNTLPSRYLSTASDAVRAWAVERPADLAPMGEPALALLGKLCLSSPSSPDLADEARALRRRLLRTAFLRSPPGYVRLRCLNFWSRIRRYAQPSGKMFAILGTDGAGKSTVIAAIKPILDDATHNATIVQHLRPGLLPPLSRLKRGGEASVTPVCDPHGSISSGLVGSFLRLSYLTLDYILGYWLKTRLTLAKHPTVVIFDRYAYDMALDPRRFRIDLPVRVIRWFAGLAPKPDLIFCLYGSPEVLAARKRELPLEEVERQVAALREFASGEPRAILISTESTVDETRNQVLSAIARYCGKPPGKSSCDD